MVSRRHVPRGQPKTRRNLQPSSQIIDSRLIDPQRLHDKLVCRFGHGNYQIEVHRCDTIHTRASSDHALTFQQMRHNKFILLSWTPLTQVRVLLRSRPHVEVSNILTTASTERNSRVSILAMNRARRPAGGPKKSWESDEPATTPIQSKQIMVYLSLHGARPGTIRSRPLSPKQVPSPIPCLFDSLRRPQQK